jgi:hypothetical protein
MKKVVVRTKSYNKPGLNPTTKNGTDMGWVEVGFQFMSVSVQSGWLAIASNKWVMASACRDVEPVEPVDPPAPAGTIYHWRKSIDGGRTFDAGIYLQVIG